MLTGIAVAALFGACLARLLAYPYDWSPDEGLHIDYARRLLSAPETLYPEASGVRPFPHAYTPLLAVVGAPFAHAAHLGVHRLPVVLWCAITFVLAVLLVRRRVRRRDAWLGGGLALGGLSMSHFLALYRVDGLMVALWLGAALVLVPPALERGAACLSPRRTLLGATLLTLAVLAKPTAVFHGAPLVVGWWWVHPRSRFGSQRPPWCSALPLCSFCRFSPEGAFGPP